MIKNIQLLNPDFVIYCKHVNHARDIYEIMRQQGITKSYAYGMLYRPTLLSYNFIKVGMSSPKLEEKREHQVGERIVRQLSWVPGWLGEKPKTANGLDFWLNIYDDLIQNNKLKSDFNKNYIDVAVWDVSKRMEESDVLLEQEKQATAWVEGELAYQHKIQYKTLPPLNYDDPSTTKAYLGSYISKTLFEKNFEIHA